MEMGDFINPYIQNAPQGGGFVVDDYPPRAAWGFINLSSDVTNVCRVYRGSDTSSERFATELELLDGTIDAWSQGEDIRLRRLVDHTGNGYDLDFDGFISLGAGAVQADSDGNVYATVENVGDRGTVTLFGSDVSLFSIFAQIKYGGTSGSDRPYGLGSGSPVFNPAGDGSVRFNDGSLSGSQSITIGTRILRTSIQQSDTINDFIDGIQNISNGSAGGRVYDPRFHMGRNGSFYGAMFYGDDRSVDRVAIEAAYNNHY